MEVSNTIIVWGPNDNEFEFIDQDDIIKEVCFSSDNKRLVSVSEGLKNNLIVWDFQGKCVYRL